jgi:hypothetical protein
MSALACKYCGESWRAAMFKSCTDNGGKHEFVDDEEAGNADGF